MSNFQAKNLNLDIGVMLTQATNIGEKHHPNE
jgi:hypothetical protein